MRPPRPLVALTLLALVALAGCVADKAPVPASDTSPLPDVSALVPVQVEDVMTFRQSVVSEAVGAAQDLYEPTMEVSDTGAIYVAAHVIGAATTGTPSWVSTDEGAHWKQMPVVGPVSLPGVVQGGQPPPGDEGFFVAGDDGRVWMADIYAAGFSVTGWCDDGGSQCYDNRQAYDRAKSTTEFCADGTDPNASTAASLNDRPWAAYSYGVGKLLLVNNPGGGPMQLGMLDIPPATPVGAMDPVTGPTWNLCSSPGGDIPGVPAMRGDGLFAVPQSISGGAGKPAHMQVVTGNIANIFDTKTRVAFDFTSSAGGTTNGGRTAFDKSGTLFVGAYNNTEAGTDDVRHGRFILAASTDGGESFLNVTFNVTSPMRSLYLDSNPWGDGVLLTWSQLGSTNFDGNNADKSDWYVAHVRLGADKRPVVSDVSLAVDEGPHSAAHVMGAALGPDGRAYFVNFADTPLQGYVLSNPISVWIQQDGPTLDVGQAPASTTATTTGAR